MTWLLRAVAFVLDSRPVQWILAGLAALAALKVRDTMKKREGREEAENEFEKRDAAEAAAIRRRVDAIDERVRDDKPDDRGYRD